MSRYHCDVIVHTTILRGHHHLAGTSEGESEQKLKQSRKLLSSSTTVAISMLSNIDIG